MDPIISTLKKSVVFLGFHIGDHIRYTGTGFIVHIDGYYHVVTAKHVVKDPKTGKRLDKGMRFYFNVKNENALASREIDQLVDEENVDWIFHENDSVDLAIIPTPLDLKTEDIVPVHSDLFLDYNFLLETQDVVFISYQPGTASRTQVNPIIRNGIISQLREDETFLIDGSAFPGNSGSPLFLKSDSLTKHVDDIPPTKVPKLIGLVGAYIPYEDVAVSQQTNDVRVVFQENSGLSICWSMKYLNDILESSKFKKQQKIVRGKKNKPATTEKVGYNDVQ